MAPVWSLVTKEFLLAEGRRRCPLALGTADGESASILRAEGAVDDEVHIVKALRGLRHQLLGDVVVDLPYFLLLRVVVQLQELTVALLVLRDFLELSGREAAELVLSGLGLVVLQGSLVGGDDVHLDGAGRLCLVVEDGLVLLPIQYMLGCY